MNERERVVIDLIGFAVGFKSRDHLYSTNYDERHKINDKAHGYKHITAAHSEWQPATTQDAAIECSQLDRVTQRASCTNNTSSMPSKIRKVHNSSGD